MPPEDAAVAAPAAAPVVVPPADQPPSKAAPKTFAERWAAVEHTVVDEPAEPASAPAVSKPEPTSTKGKSGKTAPALATGADPKEAKRAQLKTLAEELGLNVDDSAVSVAERAEHRAAVRRDREKLAAERTEWEKTKGLTPEEKLAAQRGAAILDAIERGDPDGFAKATEKFKDFNEFQQSFIRRLADPNYSELRALQAKVEAQEAEKKKVETEQQRQQQTQQRAQMLNAYMTDLTATCAKSANPLVAAMADDPLFLNAVYKIQEENWNEAEQRTITVEQAIKKAMRGAKQDLESEMRGLYARLQKAFAETQTEPQPIKTGSNGKKPAPKTAVTPMHSGGASGMPKKMSQMTPKELADYKKARYEAAEAAERAGQ